MMLASFYWMRYLGYVMIFNKYLSNKIWLGLWCLTPLSTIFQLCRGGFIVVTDKFIT
jgi:hypothetical protein